MASCILVVIFFLILFKLVWHFSEWVSKCIVYSRVAFVDKCSIKLGSGV